MTTHDQTLAEAGAMTIPEVVNIRKQLSAALARAKAAEAERNAAARRAFSAETGNQRLTAENRRLAARVAELEAALAAQGWQPVTITEPSPDFTVELIVVGYRGDDGYWHYPDGPEGLVIRGWRPVPPSVALREPTP